MDSTQIPPFTPGQCLFCSLPSPSFADSVVHMQKSHGLFVPSPEHLVVDLESLFEHLHLIIFGCLECIQCGTSRATVQAVQQHMTGKGHCTFDMDSPESEFFDFYFSDESDCDASDQGDHEDGSIGRQDESRPPRRPLQVDQESIRLPSGKIISKRAGTQPGLSTSLMRRRIRASQSTFSHTLPEPEPKAEEVGDSETTEITEITEITETALAARPKPPRDSTSAAAQDNRILSHRERREQASASRQLVSLRANDRSSLVHLPMSQQRALLASQLRQAAKEQKTERRRQEKIDRKGNKNLYAYWHTETPVYQCG